MIETAVVAVILGIVAALKGDWTEWIGAGAVLLSFGHGSIAERHSEASAKQEKPDVECWKWSMRYFVGKEILWTTYFILHQSWSALVGCALFLIYPFWRKFYRSRYKKSA